MKKTLSLVLAIALVLTMAVSFTASAGEISDYRTYETQANEVEKWCIQNSQSSRDLNVLSNCQDGLLTNDPNGTLVANIAKNWYSEDGGETWIFELNEGVKWVDYQGNVMADCIAEDWLWGLEWVLNSAKNGDYNTSMPMEMIVGAAEYNQYTKELAETDNEAALNLGLDKFLEMVGIEAPDDYTLIYHCVDKLSYFPTVCTYSCLYPISGKLLETMGSDFLAVTYDTLWYNGPYTVTEYIYQNSKVLTPNPEYWNKDAKLFNSVTIYMVEDVDKAYNLFQTGELDYVSLSESTLNTIYNSPSHEFHDYLVQARPTRYSYQIHFVYDKKNADGSADENWNKAVANEAFRLSWYYGLDLTAYLARTNSINPLSCENYAYSANNLCTTSDGRDYTSLVLERLGLEYGTGTYSRYNPELAAQYKAQAIEELTAQGVTFPVQIDYWYMGSSQTGKDTADVLTQLFSDCLGDDYVTFVANTYVSDQTQEVRNPQLASIYFNGWGADFGDPVNFVGQETYGEDSAYYSNSYSKINNATDETLIATYKEFTDLVNIGRAITDDQDARYEAFADAEAFFIQHALTIPCNLNVTWMLTCVNDYSKINAPYGMQSGRYLNYETNDQIYTTEDYEGFAAK